MRAVPVTPKPRTNKPIVIPAAQDQPTSQSLFPQHNEHAAQVAKARDVYINYEKQNLEEQIRDLQQTISINKQILQDCFSSKPNASMLAQLNAENRLLSAKLVQSKHECSRVASEKLVQEQLHCQ
jgi:hypothetical protein